MAILSQKRYKMNKKAPSVELEASVKVVGVPWGGRAGVETPTKKSASGWA